MSSLMKELFPAPVLPMSTNTEMRLVGQVCVGGSVGQMRWEIAARLAKRHSRRSPRKPRRRTPRVFLHRCRRCGAAGLDLMGLAAGLVGLATGFMGLAGGVRVVLTGLAGGVEAAMAGSPGSILVRIAVSEWWR